jgi:predicted signal transduction protein with EAL and GGDEF domain
VRLTASLGVARSPLHGSTGQDLLWAVGEALWQAKRTRDAVYVADAPVAVEPQTFRITVEQQRQLAALSRRTGRSDDSLFHEALQLLLENHAPRWHWIVEKRGPTPGGPARHGAEFE